ncbi:Hypothetical protein FKW44_005974, partial [Caligus rogercresseyi]
MAPENLDDYTSPNIWLPNSPDCTCALLPWGAVERDPTTLLATPWPQLKAHITLCFKKLTGP